MTEKILCKYCNAEKSKYGIKNHEKYCYKNETRLIFDSTGRGAKKGCVAHNKGKACSEEQKQKISLALKGKPGIKHTDEAKNKIRIKINERYAIGWEVKCGRAKKYDYISPIAGKIKVDGSWELKVAEYLDLIGVIWYRNKIRFEYFNTLKNKKSTYCPDFYVKDWNTYIEVKGYKTDLDIIKWNQFLHNLIIWQKSELKSLGIL